jgi:hypothetical protein
LGLSSVIFGILAKMGQVVEIITNVCFHKGLNYMTFGVRRREYNAKGEAASTHLTISAGH